MKGENLHLQSFHHEEFTLKHLKVLWLQAKDHERMLNQQARLGFYPSTVTYEAKLDAIVELMESITVFSVGGGLHGFGVNKDLPLAHTLHERLKSFDILFAKASSKKP